MDAILNANPEALSVRQLKSVLFENGETVPQCQTSKATFVEMFKNLQKKVRANPGEHWVASALMPAAVPSSALLSSPSTPPQSGRASGKFGLHTEIMSVVVPFPPGTPCQSTDASMESFPQSPTAPPRPRPSEMCNS